MIRGTNSVCLLLKDREFVSDTLTKQASKNKTAKIRLELFLEPNPGRKSE